MAVGASQATLCKFSRSRGPRKSLILNNFPLSFLPPQRGLGGSANSSSSRLPGRIPERAAIARSELEHVQRIGIGPVVRAREGPADGQTLLLVKHPPRRVEPEDVERDEAVVHPEPVPAGSGKDEEHPLPRRERRAALETAPARGVVLDHLDLERLSGFGQDPSPQDLPRPARHRRFVSIRGARRSAPGPTPLPPSRRSTAPPASRGAPHAADTSTNRPIARSSRRVRLNLRRARSPAPQTACRRAPASLTCPPRADRRRTPR